MLKSQELVMNFRSRKWTVLLLVFLIILSLGVFIKFSLGFNYFDRDFKGLFFNSFSKNPFARQSELKVSLTDLRLNLDFELIEEDKPKFKSFVKNWFGVDEEVKSLGFGIDENLKVNLSPNLPADLNLEIYDKYLKFKSQGSPGLQNALVKTDFNFATASGKFSLKYSDPSRFHMEMKNPEDLIFYATSSGILTASGKLDGLFKSLPQVATIELNVNGKNISGQIVLK